MVEKGLQGHRLHKIRWNQIWATLHGQWDLELVGVISQALPSLYNKEQARLLQALIG